MGINRTISRSIWTPKSEDIDHFSKPPAPLNNSHYYINSFYQTPSLSASFVDPNQVNSGYILQVSAERFFAYVPSTGTYPVAQAGEAFEVRALSSANAFVVRKYRYTATGFGKKLPANPT